MSPAAALARAIASRDCLPPRAGVVTVACTAPEGDVHRCDVCGRPLARRRSRRHRACHDASPEKRLLARAAALANPTPGGYRRRPR